MSVPAWGVTVLFAESVLHLLAVVETWLSPMDMAFFAVLSGGDCSFLSTLYILASEGHAVTPPDVANMALLLYCVPLRTLLFCDITHISFLLLKAAFFGHLNSKGLHLLSVDLLSHTYLSLPRMLPLRKPYAEPRLTLYHFSALCSNHTCRPTPNNLTFRVLGMRTRLCLLGPPHNSGHFADESHERSPASLPRPVPSSQRARSPLLSMTV